MRFLLGLVGFLLFLASVGVAMSAKSAIHEGLAAIIFLACVVCSTGAAILDQMVAMNRRSKSHEADQFAATNSAISHMRNIHASILELRDNVRHTNELLTWIGERLPPRQ